MRRLLIGLAAGAAAGCSPEIQAQREAKQLVAAQLRDPSSAQFQGLTVSRVPTASGAPATVVCGDVNAKNAFGGYGGFVQFRADLKARTVQLVDAADITGRYEMVSKCLDDALAESGSAPAKPAP
jgi:hypothetical protein